MAGIRAAVGIPVRTLESMGPKAGRRPRRKGSAADHAAQQHGNVHRQHDLAAVRDGMECHWQDKAQRDVHGGEDKSFGSGHLRCFLHGSDSLIFGMLLVYNRKSLPASPTGIKFEGGAAWGCAAASLSPRYSASLASKVSVTVMG